MNKTLLRSVREYKKQSFLAPFFVILEVLMEVLIPMEMAKIIDVGIMQGNGANTKICATIFFIKSSSFHLKISTTFLLPVW